MTQDQKQLMFELVDLLERSELGRDCQCENGGEQCFNCEVKESVAKAKRVLKEEGYHV